VPLSLSIAKFLASKGIIGAPRLDKIKSKHGSLDYRNAQGVIRDILVKSVNEDYSDALSMIEVDTFLSWGALDSAAPIDMARRALEILPRGKLDVISDGVHFAIFSDRSSLSKTIDVISNNRLGTL
jgi:pimeloyl-ACP methyl ester carboxylesterase